MCETSFCQKTTSSFSEKKGSKPIHHQHATAIHQGAQCRSHRSHHSKEQASHHLHSQHRAFWRNDASVVLKAAVIHSIMSMTNVSCYMESLNNPSRGLPDWKAKKQLANKKLDICSTQLTKIHQNTCWKSMQLNWVHGSLQLEDLNQQMWCLIGLEDYWTLGHCKGSDD